MQNIMLDVLESVYFSEKQFLLSKSLNCIVKIKKDLYKIECSSVDFTAMQVTMEVLKRLQLFCLEISNKFLW